MSLLQVHPPWGYRAGALLLFLGHTPGNQARQVWVLGCLGKDGSGVAGAGVYTVAQRVWTDLENGDTSPKTPYSAEQCS